MHPGAASAKIAPLEIIVASFSQITSFEIAVSQRAVVGELSVRVCCFWSLAVGDAPAPREHNRVWHGPTQLDQLWMLCWFARRMPRRLRAKLDPDDLFQDACVRAWRFFPRFRGETAGQYRQWLKTICRTCLIVRIEEYATLRRDARRETPLHDNQPADDGRRPLGDAQASAASGIDMVDWVDELEWLLVGFSPRRREVVVWHAIDGRTFREIAAELDCSTRTVEREWRAARDLLCRRVLSDDTWRKRLACADRREPVRENRVL